MNRHNVVFDTSFGVPEQLPPPEFLEIAFSGKSNVGKSSMINKLFNRRQLARVSSMPGKTVTINFFKLDHIRFADLPGYGYAKVAKKEKQRWSKLMEAYFRSERDLGLVFQLLDARHKPTENDLVMINFLIDSEIPFVIVLTKIDKLSNTGRTARLEALKTEVPEGEDITMIPFSAVTGEGVEDVWGIIEEIAAQEQ
ncbi:MAG: ribosome biogenesis GTP-binding protein YihA/YsxC [Oscillospiraceae bacterium]|nr:ribosome biogenesis GTP-binding protein YihA/YsxC [Oscillospiraceae bacterium]